MIRLGLIASLAAALAYAQSAPRIVYTKVVPRFRSGIRSDYSGSQRDGVV